MKKRVFIFAIPCVVLFLFVWLFFFKDAGRYKVIQAIPEDAVFRVEIPSFNHVHESLSRNQIWKSLKYYPYFEAYHEYLERGDSLCKAYPTLKRMLTDRPISISYHEISPSLYDFLYVCDLGTLNVIKTFEGVVSVLLTNENLKIESVKGSTAKFRELKSGNFKLYFAIKGNLLIASCSRDLVERSLVRCEERIEVKNELSGGDAVIQIDHKRVTGAISTFLEVASATGKVSLLDFTRFVLQLNDQELSFTGITKPGQEDFSVLNSLQSIRGGESEIFEIAGEQTAAYITCCFPSFLEWQEILLDDYKKEHEKEYNTLKQSIERVNKFLGVDVFDLFTSWIGNEIAIIKPTIDEQSRRDNIVLAIRAKDIVYAEDQMNYLAGQIDRKTPVREKSMEYNGYKIHYFSLKGFFKLFFQSMFEQIDRPYYTFIGDYVVFSNSPLSLAGMIKEYILGKTLANDEEYKRFMKNLGNDNTIYAYVNTSNVYDFLYYDLKTETRKELEKNKGAFLGFEQMGLSLSNRDDLFKTKVIATYNKNAPEEYKMRELNRELEREIDKIESGFYYPVIPDSIAVSSRRFYEYTIPAYMIRGALKDGDPDGCWDILDRSGKMIGILPYEEGKINGEARFFYKEGDVMARVTYRKGEIQMYKEFFQDGSLKMEMPFRKGLRHGTVKFYYKTGHLFGEGRYKKGFPSGKRQYYQITGEKRTNDNL